MVVSDNGNIGTRGENLSILIPTYNCAEYLRETLRSLRGQGDILSQAQIQVVDDVSSKDDPEQVVREEWAGKVSFFRQPQNLGACGNFNSCIERAERPWIHILHGDDYVLPGAYQEFYDSIASAPDCIAVFARSIIVDKESVWHEISDVLGKAGHGPLPYDPLRWRICPVQFAGVLFSRRAVEKVGKFDCAFGHVQDWNLWWRMAMTGQTAYSTRCIGAYRVFDGNHSSTLTRTGKNLEEILEQLNRQAETLKAMPVAGVTEDDLYRPMFFKAYKQCLSFARTDREAFTHNLMAINHWPKGARSRFHMMRLKLAPLQKG